MLDIIEEREMIKRVKTHSLLLREAAVTWAAIGAEVVAMINHACDRISM
jgi:hypothetical protein